MNKEISVNTWQETRSLIDLVWYVVSSLREDMLYPSSRSFWTLRPGCHTFISVALFMAV